MKLILHILLIFTLASCSNESEKPNADLLGCWKLVAVDGKNESTNMQFVKYKKKKAKVYWASETEYGLIVNPYESTYTIEMVDGKREITFYGDNDTVTSIIEVKGDQLSLQVKGKSLWTYKRISQKELDDMLKRAVDPAKIGR